MGTIPGGGSSDPSVIPAKAGFRFRGDDGATVYRMVRPYAACIRGNDTLARQRCGTSAAPVCASETETILPTSHRSLDIGGNGEQLLVQARHSYPVFHVVAEIGRLGDVPAQPVTAWRQQQCLRPDRQFRRTLDGAVVRQRQQQRAEAHRGHLALTAFDRHRHDVGIADEVGDEVAVRLFVQAPRRAVLRDARHAHHHDAVGDRQRLLLVVRDVNRGERQVLLQLADLLAHMAAQLGVQIGQRLVEQQHLRLQHDRARHRDALLLAAGQFAGQAGAIAGKPDQARVLPSANSTARALRIPEARRP